MSADTTPTTLIYDGHENRSYVAPQLHDPADEERAAAIIAELLDIAARLDHLATEAGPLTARLTAAYDGDEWPAVVDDLHTTGYVIAAAAAAVTDGDVWSVAQVGRWARSLRARYGTT